METGEGSNPQGHTVDEISKVVTDARREVLGIEPKFGYSQYGDVEILQKVRSAYAKAMRESGDEWKQTRQPGKRVEIKYDHSHVAGILDALDDYVGNSAERVRRDYKAVGITPEVLRRAEEMLFGVETSSGAESKE